MLMKSCWLLVAVVASVRAIPTPEEAYRASALPYSEADPADYGEERATTKEPNYLSKAVNVTAKKGQAVTFPCQVDELGSYALLWWFIPDDAEGQTSQTLLFANGVKVTQQANVKYTNKDLTIENVQSEASGKYMCSLSTAGGKNLVHRLMVETEPKVKARARDVVVGKGATAAMGCIVLQGVPPPKITWAKDGEPLKWTGAEVEISQVDHRNAGKYTCTASNEIGSPSSDSIQLSVMFPPEIQVQEEWIHSGEGYQAEIACIVKGEPKPIVEWFRGPNKLNGAGSTQYKTSNAGAEYTLQIDGLKESDFGFYACAARNQQGQDRKEIQVSGIAKNVNFTSPPNGDAPDSYRAAWEVESYSPVMEYQFQYREVNDSYSGKWESMSLKGESPAGSTLKHKHTIKLSGLSPASQYDAAVKVKNKFGWSKMSEPLFRFATLGAQVPVPEPISGAPASPTAAVILLLSSSLFSLLL